MRGWLGLLVLACGPVVGQTAPDADAIPVGPDVVPPKLVHHVEPKFSREARSAGVQGTVVLEATVDEAGSMTNLVVLRPLGFGLDETAADAVRRWRFAPGTKDGKPVRILAQIEVNFRLLGSWRSTKDERRWADYKAALIRFSSTDGLDKTSAAEAMRRLVRDRFAPAMFTLAMWIEAGQVTPEGSEDVAKLLGKAADMKLAEAMYEVGRRTLLGLNREKGLKLIHEAAFRGSRQAQENLGRDYEAGEDVPQDRELALKYFRLCAGGVPACQFAVARILLSTPSRNGRDMVEAVARLELAADQAFAPARALLGQERPNVTAEQAERAVGLKKTLAPAQ